MTLPATIRLFFLILSMGLAGCGVPDTATMTLRIPEAASLAELNLIRSALLKEQKPLPERMTFYHKIEVSLSPEPALIVRYNPRHIRTKNILFKVNELGYAVRGRPGNSEKRSHFLSEVGGL